jgi:SH3-like domain-containing protein
MKSRVALIASLALTALVPAADAQQQRQVPYWASITAGQAMMRTGPGREYPAEWLYVRRDLPVQVVEVYQNWRKVRDPDGATGWMLANLLSAERTAMVRGNGPQPIHNQPESTASVRHRAEPGVIGRISECDNGWCRFQVGDRGGYISAAVIWGISRGEVVD